MSEVDSIWDEVFERPLDETTANVIPFMNQQCDELHERSGGLVNAQFREIKLCKPVGAPQTALEVAYAEMMRSAIPPAEIDVNALGLEDASQLYATKRYGFETYNSTYEFRAFVANVSAMYPITLAIDETIARESREELSSWLCDDKRPNIARISTDEDLRSCFYAIIRSRKMRFVLNALKEGS